MRRRCTQEVTCVTLSSCFKKSSRRSGSLGQKSPEREFHNVVSPAQPAAQGPVSRGQREVSLTAGPVRGELGLKFTHDCERH